MSFVKSERMVGLAVIVLAAGLVYLSTTWLAFWQSAILWGLFALGLAILSRQGVLKLFGPVLLYDMIRTGRRVRYAVIRMLYAGLLLFILCYLMLILSITVNQQQIMGRHTAMLAESFFFTFILLQLSVVVFLTPAYVAGAISEEKDRKTLEFLLATDLRDGEIIMSKLLARLANMSLLLITGLPLLSILQFVGGVDPQLMLAGFAATGLTMLGVAGVSMMISTAFQKPRDAISLTYLLLVAYFAVAILFMALQGWPLMNTPIWLGNDPPAFVPTFNDLGNMLNAGNPIAAITAVINAISGRGGARLVSELPNILTRYAWFHCTVAFVTIGYSILRMRDIALKYTSSVKSSKLRWWQRLRPRVGDYPMLWKEFYIEAQTKLNWIMWGCVFVLLLLTIGSGLFVLGVHVFQAMSGNPNPWRHLPEAMNIWFRITGTGVACLMLLMLAVRASTAITNERERDTLDALVTTPLSALNILTAKMLGNLTSLRLGWLWFGVMLAMAVCTLGVHPLAVPFILGAWFVYALVVTMIGLFFSMLCKTSMLATFYTVMATVFFGGGHWVIWYCCGMPLAMAIFFLVQQHFPGNKIPWEHAMYFLKFLAGLTPPAVFGFGSFSWDELSRFEMREIMEMVVFYLVGLILWIGACVIAWYALLVPKFRRLTRRIELMYR